LPWLRRLNSMLRNFRVGLLVLASFAAIGAVSFAAAAEPKCACRAQGHSFELGQWACVRTPNGPRIAICVMVLNNTSWQISDTPCVSAARAGSLLNIKFAD